MSTPLDKWRKKYPTARECPWCSHAIHGVECEKEVSEDHHTGQVITCGCPAGRPWKLKQPIPDPVFTPCPTCKTVLLSLRRFLHPEPARNAISRFRSHNGHKYICSDCGKAEALAHRVTSLTFAMARVVVFQEREERRRGAGGPVLTLHGECLPPGEDPFEYEVEIVDENDPRVEEIRQVELPPICGMCRKKSEPGQKVCKSCREF